MSRVSTREAPFLSLASFVLCPSYTWNKLCLVPIFVEMLLFLPRLVKKAPSTMNTSDAQSSDARPDRLLTTLEHLLAIDAIQVKPALQQAAQLIGEALYAEKVDVFFHESITHSLLALGSNDSPKSRLQRALALDRLPIANRGRIVEVFLTGDSFLSGQLDQDEEELRGMRVPEPEGMGIVSEIAASISMQGERRGVLMAASGMHTFFTQQDLHFLEADARWIGMVMHLPTLRGWFQLSRIRIRTLSRSQYCAGSSGTPRCGVRRNQRNSIHSFVTGRSRTNWGHRPFCSSQKKIM